MKHIKKTVALFLALVLSVGCFSMTAMAAENTETNIPANAVRHEVELTVSADGTIENIETLSSAEGATVMPRAWWQNSYNVPTDATYTPAFTVPERYFAFEMSATDYNGNAVSGYYRVDLLSHTSMGSIAFINKPINGISYKLDWIDLQSTNKACLFKISNGSNTPIKVTLTYYSWS